MLATIGYIVPEYFRFPGFLSPSQDLKFADVPNGLAALSKVPGLGWVQIFFFAGVIEGQWEFSGKKTGPGEFGWKVITSEDPEEKVWGVAYEIPAEEEENVRQHLDFREKCGYSMASITFHPQDSDISPFNMDIYIGTEDNPHFLGPAALEEMATQIFNSVGPSGKNVDYLLQLATAVKSLMPGVRDDHLFELESAVKRLAEAK